MAVQAGRDVTVHHGVTTAEAFEIAREVFRAGFVELTRIAREEATARSEYITQEFLNKLQRENPDGLKLANDPGFQAALFTVQKQYACTGDKHLGDLLVDLLVDRTKQPNRDILQIVLGESLDVAPKLTDGQLAALSLIFLLRYTIQHNVKSHAHLGTFFDRFVAPFAPKLVKNAASYQHLEYCGCGSNGAVRSLLWQILVRPYQGLFMRGFDSQELTTRGISSELASKLVVPCLNDSAKLQIWAQNSTDLRKALDRHGASQDQETRILALYESNTMPDAQLKAVCVGLREFMSGVFDVWDNSQMATFLLTSVGIAIGHANIKRLAGGFTDLSIWIN